jgi:hypothetical protein
MLLRLRHALLCTLILFAVAASARAQTTGHPAASPTSTTLSCTVLGPVSAGETIPLIATVLSSGGTPVGHVNFTQNNVSLGGASLSNGSASLTARAYAGTDSFVATFPEQDGFATSSASCDIQVGALGLHSNNNPALAYSNISFIAVLSTQPFPGGDFSISINNGPPVMLNGGARNPGVASYTTDTLASGTYTVTATFIPADGSAPSTATITQVVTAATGDFTLTGYPPSLTVRDGLTVSSLIAATSIDDFHGPVSLSCSVPQAIHYTCTLTPTSVQLLLNDYETSTLTLTPTKAPIARIPNPHPGSGASRILLASFLPFSLLSLAAFAGFRRRPSFRSLLCLFVLALVAASTTACGPDVFTTATAAGVYPVTITATGVTPGEPAITHTLNLNLNLTY